MKTWCLATLIVVVLPADDRPDDAVKKERESLKGKWVLMHKEFEGREVPVEKRECTIDDEKFVYPATAESPEWVASYELDPSMDPKAITFKYKGATKHGIYKLEKDKLTLCLSRPGSKRPTEFVTKEGIEVVLVVYNRYKP